MARRGGHRHPQRRTSRELPPIAEPELRNSIFGKEFVRDSLDWLDKYLAPVKR
jgi:hypothetical protein